MAHLVSKINEFGSILIWWEIIKVNIKQLTDEVSKTFNTSKYQLAKIEKRLNEIKDSDKYIHKKESKNLQSKMISNDQELIQSDPTSCPQNQKGNN